MASKATYLGMEVEPLARALIDGIQANMPESDKVMYGGKLLGKAELVAALVEVLGPYVAAEAARKELVARIAARSAAVPDAIAVLKQVDGALTAQYSADPHAKAKLGIPPPPNRRKLTAAEKALRAEKARVTRELRHTKGPRAKQKIKATGELTLSITSETPGPLDAPAVEQPTPSSASAPVATRVAQPSAGGEVRTGVVSQMLMSGAGR